MTQLLRSFELDPFDLLWRDLIDTQSHFSAITQKVTHPVDIFETQDGILFEIAAVGLDQEDIEILIEADQLRIKYEKVKPFNQDAAIYRGIKRSGFDLSWKISTKFDLSQLTANLDKGLLSLSIPVAEGKAIRKVEINASKAVEDKKKK
jgi:HSP20 family molecular chaperone IbpA